MWASRRNSAESHSSRAPSPARQNRRAGSSPEAPRDGGGCRTASQVLDAVALEPPPGYRPHDASTTVAPPAAAFNKYTGELSAALLARRAEAIAGGAQITDATNPSRLVEEAALDVGEGVDGEA